MLGGTASWHFLDVESGRVPEEASSSVLPEGGEGRIVALGSTSFARSNGWAGRAAVSIAAAWAREGRRIFLMDLGLEAPSLHEVLALPNREGVSDAFLYGASVQRIAQPALDDAIFFAPAGTATVDPEEVLSHPRWLDLAGGFSETDATLLLFLPSEIPGAESILSLATDILFLAAQGESADAFLGSASSKVVATLGPLAPLEEGGEEDDASGRAKVVETARGPGLSAAGEDSEVEGEEGAVQEGAVQEGTETPDDDALAAEFELAANFLPGRATEDETPDVSSDMPSEQWRGDPAWRREDDPLPVPDFGAEFAELPSLEDGSGDEDVATGSVEVGGDLGRDLLPASDFGGFQGGDRDGGGAGPDAPPPQDREAPSKPDPEPVRRGSAFQPRRPRRRRPPPRRRLLGSPVIVILALAAVSVAAAGTVLGAFNLPGFGFVQSLTGRLPDPPLVLPGPEPNEPLLRYSLELFRYHEEELAFAAQMRSELRSRFPGLLFVLAPDDSRGTLSYALLAGPATALLDVENLRATIAEVITREPPESWRIRETPRAFLLGERATLAEAREYLASVEDKGVFGYVLHATFPGGTDTYLVLTGAYQGVADARPLQLILHRRGFREVPLIERRGRLPE